MGGMFSSGEQQVDKVYYHTLDITDKVKELCQKNTDGKWVWEGSNTQLDRAFGDPCAGVTKQVTVMHEKEQHKLQHLVAYTFRFDSQTKNLFVIQN